MRRVQVPASTRSRPSWGLQQLEDNDELDYIPDNFNAEWDITRCVKDGRSPRLRSDPQAATASAKRVIRKLISEHHESLGLDEDEAQSIKEGMGRGTENEITAWPCARGSIAATEYRRVGYKRSWTDKDDEECHAYFTVEISIMRVVP